MEFRVNALVGASGLPEKPPMFFTDSSESSVQEELFVS